MARDRVRGGWQCDFDARIGSGPKGAYFGTALGLGGAAGAVLGGLVANR